MLTRLRHNWNKIPYNGAGVLFAFEGSDGWEVLLFHRAIEPDRGTWSVVGGRCEPGESYRESAEREMSEEALGNRQMTEVLGDYLAVGFSMDQAREHIQCNLPGIYCWRNYLVELQAKPLMDMFQLKLRERRSGVVSSSALAGSRPLWCSEVNSLFRLKHVRYDAAEAGNSNGYDRRNNLPKLLVRRARSHGNSKRWNR